MSSAIVIGGGPAGSAAALLLRRAGWEVDLIEQHVFPRDKVCGECLSSVGLDVLDRAGALPILQQFAPARLRRSLLHPIDGPTIELILPRESMGISRLRMDQALLNLACEQGVRIHQPARCETVVASPQSPHVVWRDLRSNTRHQLNADWVIVADGKGALLSKRHAATGDIGIKTHFANVDGPCDAIELFAGRGHYGGLAAVEDNCWNAAFSVPSTMVRHYGGDLQMVFDQVAETNPSLSRRLTSARRIGPWLAAPVPRFAVANRWLDRIIPVGNAAAALEPVGGEGMGLALRSAELATNALIGNDIQMINELPVEFKKLWQVRRAVCRSIAMIFSCETFADAIAPLLQTNQAIPNALMRLSGKGS